MHIGALTNRPAALGVETECRVGLGDALTCWANSAIRARVTRA